VQTKISNHQLEAAKGVNRVRSTPPFGQPARAHIARHTGPAIACMGTRTHAPRLLAFF
jgi:hypothetical protein